MRPISFRTKAIASICALVALAVPAAIAVGIGFQENASPSTGESDGAGVGGNVGPVGPDPGFGSPCSFLSEGASNSSASWNVLVDGPEGDHALVDDDGAL